MGPFSAGAKDTVGCQEEDGISWQEEAMRCPYAKIRRGARKTAHNLAKWARPDRRVRRDIQEIQYIIGLHSARWFFERLEEARP